MTGNVLYGRLNAANKSTRYYAKHNYNLTEIIQ